MQPEAIRWIDLPSRGDERGTLTSIESGLDIPFAIQRIFYMHHVREDRGGHAHIDTDQVVIATSGRFVLELEDAHGITRHVMDDATRGLYIPRLVFIDIREISADAVCLVLASTHYDMGRSLRTREAWQQYLQAGKAR